MAQGDNFKVVILGEGCVGKTCILLRNMEALDSYKVCLLGEGSVGKTSILLQYAESKFNESHVPTIQASFLTKKLNIDGKRVVLSIWDTAGQERFHALGPIYYRGSKGAILVYDITDEDSFRKVTNWVKELKQTLPEEIPLCIVGNKIDLERERHVSLQSAEEYATSVGAKHFQTSAKLNRGLNELFLDLSRRMQANVEAEMARNANRGDRRASHRDPILVVDDSANERKKGCC